MTSPNPESPRDRSRPAVAPLQRAPDGTSLYVHLPFCAAKCHYCDFFSVPDEGHDLEAMVDAILAEARARAPRAPRTVFLGGGTPSLLPVDLLTRLLNGLEACTGFRDSALEVTAECNPESLDADKVRALRDLGVRRLSIGFQSLDDEVLQLFGRVHSVADSFRAFDAARAAGADDLNVDLIYAVPGQTAESWERDLGRVLDLEPDHLSAYNLTFEEETRFRRWLDSGRLARAPEETELACFEAARRITMERGLHAYEISNYARPGRECRHNIVYWHNEPYVGIGPSAVSRVGATRAGNVKAITAYLRQVGSAGHATAWDETLPASTRLAETWWLGLRLATGVDPAAARRTAGFDESLEDPCVTAAERLERGGLLEFEGEHWRLTREGLPVADAIASELLSAASESESGRNPGSAPEPQRAKKP